MIRQTFKKSEKLTNKKIFDELFAKGESFSSIPFRFIWTPTKSTFVNPVQLGISVPKKLFSKAVDRNRMKRRIREAYRKNKQLLYGDFQKKNLSIALMIIYTTKEQISYQEIEKKMIVSLQKMLTLIK